MTKDFSEVYSTKEFPESEPLSKLIGLIFAISAVEFLPSQYGTLALVKIGDDLFRTTSEVLYEQLVFVKRALDEGHESVTVKLVKKVSSHGREYQSFVSALKE